MPSPVRWDQPTNQRTPTGPAMLLPTMKSFAITVLLVLGSACATAGGAAVTPAAPSADAQPYLGFSAINGASTVVGAMCWEGGTARAPALDFLDAMTGGAGLAKASSGRPGSFLESSDGGDLWSCGVLGCNIGTPVLVGAARQPCTSSGITRATHALHQWRPAVDLSATCSAPPSVWPPSTLLPRPCFLTDNKAVCQSDDTALFCAQRQQNCERGQLPDPRQRADHFGRRHHRQELHLLSQPVCGGFSFRPDAQVGRRRRSRSRNRSSSTIRFAFVYNSYYMYKHSSLRFWVVLISVMC